MVNVLRGFTCGECKEHYREEAWAAHCCTDLDKIAKEVLGLRITTTGCYWPNSHQNKAAAAVMKEFASDKSGFSVTDIDTTRIIKALVNTLNKSQPCLTCNDTGLVDDADPEFQHPCPDCDNYKEDN